MDHPCVEYEDRWDAETCLDRVEILNRFPTEYLPGIQRRAPDPTTRFLTEDAFIDQVSEVEPLLKSSVGRKSCEIIYNSLYYLSSAPFPSLANVEEGLSAQELARAFQWIIPTDGGRSDFPETYDTFSRTRTAADHRRTIFQSLASPRVESNPDFQSHVWEELAKENALDVSYYDESDLPLVINRDADGDELFHDILDVVFWAQPHHVPPLYGPSRREAFRESVKELHKTSLRLHHLSIETSRFRPLVEVLLQLQWDEDDGSDEEDGSGGHRAYQIGSEAVDAVVNAFTTSGQTYITWPAFDFAMKKIAPNLFTPLYRILSDALLSDEYCLGDDLVGTAPAPPTSRIADSQILDQLGTFLITRTLSRLTCKSHYDNHEMHTRSLSGVIQAYTTSLLVLVSGSSSGWGKCLAGAYIPRIVDDSGKPEQRQAKVFQLRPVQDASLSSGEISYDAVRESLRIGNDSDDLRLRLCGDLLMIEESEQNKEDLNRRRRPERELTSFKVEALEIWTES